MFEDNKYRRHGNHGETGVCLMHEQYFSELCCRE
jgi:hypothetical protein